MFISTKFNEETGRPPGLFRHVGIFLAWLGQVRVFEKLSVI